MAELYLINGSLAPKAQQPLAGTDFSKALLDAGFILHAAQHLERIADDYADTDPQKALALYDAVLALTKASNSVVEVA